MRRCPLGNIQFRWERGHPLNAVLARHFVYAVTPMGGSAAGLLEVADPRCTEAAVGGFELFDDDRLFHADDVCARASCGPADGAGATFYLARLHHQRLHEQGLRHPRMAVSCPTCRLPFFADREHPDGEAALRAASAILARECPDHRGQFTT